MLFDLTFPCYLTTFSGKKCLSGKVICAFFCPAYRNSPVLNLTRLLESDSSGRRGGAASREEGGPQEGAQEDFER
jgi:hypothetical protein